MEIERREMKVEVLDVLGYGYWRSTTVFAALLGKYIYHGGLTIGMQIHRCLPTHVHGLITKAFLECRTGPD